MCIRDRRSIVGNVADLTRIRKEALQDDSVWTQPDAAIDKPAEDVPKPTQTPAAAEKPAATVSVPKEKLTELGSPAYVVRVSSGGLALYFQITVISPPAVVDLARPAGGLYVLDSIESLPLSYTFSNFVKDQEGSQYELYLSLIHI